MADKVYSLRYIREALRFARLAGNLEEIELWSSRLEAIKKEDAKNG